MTFTPPADALTITFPQPAPPRGRHRRAGVVARLHQVGTHRTGDTMTTTPHDFIRLEGPASSIDLNCNEYGIPWPPPAQITHVGDQQLDLPFNLVTHSDITDDEALNDPTVARGALYWPINYEGTEQ